jgi:hypothetical protein
MPSPSPFVEGPFKSREFDPEPARETIRGRITLVSACTFFLVIAFYLSASWLAAPQSWPQIKEAMQAILPAVTSVLGTALGFYFGSQKR